MTAPRLKEPQIMSGRTRHGAERWSWIFMRISGPILLVLIVTHLFINLMTGDGISQVDFAFVAGKLASPFWQWFDFTMLLLAMLHGFNGMRLLINDYARKPVSRKVLHALLGTATVVIIVLGTLVLFTFDPCPADSPADLLPSFCPTA